MSRHRKTNQGTRSYGNDATTATTMRWKHTNAKGDRKPLKHTSIKFGILAK